MKTKYALILCLVALPAVRTLGQTQPPPVAIPARLPVPGLVAHGPELTKFTLDFRGGTPKELVAAIEKATGRPLNAIVPDQIAETQLPALRMNNVDVSQLFAALMLASRKSESYRASNYPGGYQIMNTACGFRTEGTPSDDSIWYFFVERPATPPPAEPAKVCRFYSLAPYLEDGVSVDDITTAIQTGWKMLGDTSMPTISFHKDTKLLIAVGDPGRLELIDSVLKTLKAANYEIAEKNANKKRLSPENKPEPKPEK